MTTPVEQERMNLEQLAQALAYARSVDAIRQTLQAFTDLADEAIEALLSMGHVRTLVRTAPRPSDHAAVQAMFRHNLLRRAAYLVQAARRLTSSVRGPTNGRHGRLQDAVEIEKTYLEQHLDALAKRTRAAEAVAKEAKREAGNYFNFDRPRGRPPLIGWYATMDERTSPECRQANGRNFDPTRVPRIGFPGAVHPHCRCRPGPPHRTHLRVEDLQPEPRSATGVRPTAEIAAVRQAGGWVISGGIV